MTVSLPVEEVIAVALASVRVLAVFVPAPLFGHTAVSPRIRGLLALAVAIAIHPAPIAGVSLAEPGLAEAFGWVLAESLLGLSIGFLSQLIFAAFGLLGEFISIQGGLGAARVIDPASGASSVALAAALQAFALMIFVAIDGHHMLLHAVRESFVAIPVAGGAPSPDVFIGVALAGSVVFETAVRMALPVTVAMFVANSALGMLGRAVPQLNLMTLQLPAHVAGVLLLVGLGAPGFVDAAVETIGPWTQAIPEMVAGGD